MANYFIRVRCYVASLQGTELPNPQVLILSSFAHSNKTVILSPFICFIQWIQSVLGSVSKPTKIALGRVGIFSVASLHAIVSARHGGGPSSGSGSSSLGSGRTKGSPASSVSV